MISEVAQETAVNGVVVLWQMMWQYSASIGNNRDGSGAGCGKVTNVVAVESTVEGVVVLWGMWW